MREYNFHEKFSLYRRKRKSGLIYYARFRTPAGKFGTGVSTSQTSRAAARTWCETYLKTRNDLQMWNAPSKPNHSSEVRTVPTLRDYSSGFFAPNGPYHVAHQLFRKSKKELGLVNLRNHSTRLELHIIPRLGGKRLNEITTMDFRNLQLDLAKVENGLSTQSIVHVVNTLSVILKQAADEGLINAIPLIRRITVDHRERGVFTLQEARELLSKDWPDIRHKAISLLAATTGMRMSEILGLTWEAIESDHIAIFATWSEREKRLRGTRHNPATKAGRIRYVPLAEEAKEFLKILMERSIWTEPTDLVFSVEKGRPVREWDIPKNLASMLRTIGIDDTERIGRNLSFHSWRHFYNSALLNARIPLVKVQAVVGHTSLKMSENYYHADEMADVRKVVASIFKESKKRARSPRGPISL